MKLVETMNTPQIVIESGEAFTMRVPILIADYKGQNGRTYPLSAVRAAVSNTKKRLTSAASAGSTSHIKELHVDAVSHLMTDIWLKDKTVMADLRIIPTDKGRNLSALLRGGGAVGLSIRAKGSVNAEGIVGDDLEIVGVDFVLNPAFPLTASAKNIFESAVLPDPVTEEEILERYRQALIAGWKKDYAAYRRAYMKGLVDV